MISTIFRAFQAAVESAGISPKSSKQNLRAIEKEEEELSDSCEQEASAPVDSIIGERQTTPSRKKRVGNSGSVSKRTKVVLRKSPKKSQEKMNATAIENGHGGELVNGSPVRSSSSLSRDDTPTIINGGEEDGEQSPVSSLMNSTERDTAELSHHDNESLPPGNADSNVEDDEGVEVEVEKKPTAKARNGSTQKKTPAKNPKASAGKGSKKTAASTTKKTNNGKKKVMVSSSTTKAPKTNAAVESSPTPPLEGSSQEGSKDLPMIKGDVTTRMMPKDSNALSTVSDFDHEPSLPKFKAEREEVLSSLRSGLRTEKQAMSEFKIIRVNERVYYDESGENGKPSGDKPRKHRKKDDEDSEEEPCKCTEKDACSTDQCLNRGLQIECNPKLCPVELKKPGSCQNMRLYRMERKKCEVRVSENKGCGLFAMERIPRGALVQEYVGEVIDEQECNRRLDTVYVDEKHKYLMCMNGGLLIDATRRGNVARFINHSCDPNCKVQEWQVRKQPRMGIFAIKDIDIGDEISFDYNFQRFGEGDLQKCHCGAKTCRGYLGRKQENSDDEDDGPNGASLARKKKKMRMGQDPVVGDNVGRFMDETASKKAENFILDCLDIGVPESDKKRAQKEGLFLVRNVMQALEQVYAIGGRFGWKAT